MSHGNRSEVLPPAGAAGVRMRNVVPDSTDPFTPIRASKHCPYDIVLTAAGLVHGVALRTARPIGGSGQPVERNRLTDRTVS